MNRLKFLQRFKLKKYLQQKRDLKIYLKSQQDIERNSSFLLKAKEIEYRKNIELLEKAHKEFLDNERFRYELKVKELQNEIQILQKEKAEYNELRIKVVEILTKVSTLHSRLHYVTSTFSHNYQITLGLGDDLTKLKKELQFLDSETS